MQTWLSLWHLSPSTFLSLSSFSKIVGLEGKLQKIIVVGYKQETRHYKLKFIFITTLARVNSYQAYYLLLLFIFLASQEELDEMAGDSSNERKNFAQKVEISAKHIKWLKENQMLLNVLLNYCTLHGASGGDVASEYRRKY